jgi:hypothetical protein
MKNEDFVEQERMFWGRVYFDRGDINVDCKEYYTAKSCRMAGWKKNK